MAAMNKVDLLQVYSSNALETAETLVRLEEKYFEAPLGANDIPFKKMVAEEIICDAALKKLESCLWESGQAMECAKSELGRLEKLVVEGVPSRLDRSDERGVVDGRMAGAAKTRSRREHQKPRGPKKGTSPKRGKTSPSTKKKRKPKTAEPIPVFDEDDLPEANAAATRIQAIHRGNRTYAVTK